MTLSTRECSVEVAIDRIILKEPWDEVQVQCGSQMVYLNSRTKCRVSVF